MIRAGKKSIMIDTQTAYRISAMLEETKLYLDKPTDRVLAEEYINKLIESANEIEPPFETRIDKPF